MEKYEERTKKQEPGDKDFQELGNLKKENRYRYFVRASLHAYKEASMRQAIKKRLACRNFEGKTPSGSVKPKHLAFLKQSVKGIQNLKLNFCLNQEDTNLREAIKRHRSLQKVDLWIRGITNEKQLKNLSESVKSSHNLRTVVFHFDSSGLMDQDLQRLGQCFKRMRNLKHSKLTFKDRGASIKGLQALGRGFKRLSFLDDINLRLYMLENKVFQGLGQGLKGMRSLAKVNIGSDFFWSNSEEVETLKLALKEFGFIQNLGLEVHNVNEQAVKALTGNLNTLQLKHLLLKFAGGFNHLIRETFIENLGSASHLESLQLTYPTFPVLQEQDIVLLSQSLPKLHSLKSLNLDFSSCKGVSDEGLETLGQTFEKVALLKSVTIDFPALPNCTSKGFHALKDGLSKAKCLEKIKLRLFTFIAVDDGDLQQFMESLEGLPSLKDLVLTFEVVPRLTEKALNAISESLKRMHSIQSVELSFLKCGNVSKQDTVELIQKLRDLPIKLSYKHKGKENSLFD